MIWIERMGVIIEHEEANYTEILQQIIVNHPPYLYDDVMWTK